MVILLRIMPCRFCKHCLLRVAETVYRKDSSASTNLPLRFDETAQPVVAPAMAAAKKECCDHTLPGSMPYIPLHIPDTA
jgi:hypothetical protein